ncbi:MAG: tRNA 2-thiouridine(34) synthase MnmA, partial [Lachnospiraceae bacterium]|nr:tRNA 2-thiouridine(34) synthase MnmA [Lachnospiraceae bacterium]
MDESRKALIAMSGGVDSSVAAKLTQDRGYECIGCMMKLYDITDDEADTASRTCCSVDDADDARNVAYRLGMPFYVFNFKDDFRKQVID